MSCPFCDDPEVQQRIIIKNELVVAFPSYMPIVPGHVLICPVRHAATLEELEPEEIKAVYELLKRIKVALKDVYGAEGFNVAFNEGVMAGQSVPHFHVHVVPRKQGDAGVIDYEPRKYLYWPGTRDVSPLENLKHVADLIKQKLEERSHK